MCWTSVMTSLILSVAAVYVTSVMIIASLSLVCTIIVLQLHPHDITSPPPKWLKTLTLGYLARLLCYLSNTDPRFRSYKQSLKKNYRQDGGQLPSNEFVQRQLYLQPVSNKDRNSVTMKDHETSADWMQDSVKTWSS